MRTLKDCLYETNHHNDDKPLKAIAEEIGMTENYLTRAALPDQEESETGSGCRFPLKKIIPLIRVTNDFSVLDYIENSLGRVAIKIPQHHGKDMADIYRLTMQSVKEFGHLMSEIDAGVADGILTEREKDRIIKEGYEAIQAVTALVKFIETEKTMKG